MSRPSWSLLVVAAALAAFASSLGPVGDYDLWWHLAYGRGMVATGAFPRVDTFTYTLPGTPVTNFEGLSQLIFYLVYAGAGIPGLVLAKAGVLAAAMAFVVLAARARGASPLATGLAAGLALPMLLRRSLVRPEAFSYLCLALTAWLLALWLGGRRRARWALVPLVALWTNLHAGMVPLGLLLAALAALHEVVNAPAAERWRRLGEGALLGVLLAAACLASPLGLDVLTVLLRGATYDNTLQQNPDWMPFALDAFGFARPAPWYAAVLLVGLAAPLLARGWRRERLFDTLALVLFATGVAFCAFVVLPFTLRYLQSFLTDLFKAEYSVEYYMSFVANFALWIGVAFELPLVIALLARLGIVTPQMLNRTWRYAIVIAAVMAAVITP